MRLDVETDETGNTKTARTDYILPRKYCFL